MLPILLPQEIQLFRHNGFVKLPTQLSLEKITALHFIVPFIVTILAVIFLKEKVGIRRWIAVIVGFIGSLIVMRPGFLDVNLASLSAFGCGVCYGFYLIITRKLSNTDNPLLTLLFTGVVGAIIMTSMSTMFALMPLVIGNIGPGAGEGSRLAVGSTILGGMIISTFFTLYVTPTMYVALAKNTQRIDAIDIELKKQLR